MLTIIGIAVHAFDGHTQEIHTGVCSMLHLHHEVHLVSTKTISCKPSALIYYSIQLNEKQGAEFSIGNTKWKFQNLLIFCYRFTSEILLHWVLLVINAGT